MKATATHLCTTKYSAYTRNHQWRHSRLRKRIRCSYYSHETEELRDEIYGHLFDKDKDTAIGLAATDAPTHPAANAWTCKQLNQETYQKYVMGTMRTTIIVDDMDHLRAWLVKHRQNGAPLPTPTLLTTSTTSTTKWAYVLVGSTALGIAGFNRGVLEDACGLLHDVMRYTSMAGIRPPDGTSHVMVRTDALGGRMVSTSEPAKLRGAQDRTLSRLYREG